MFNELITENRRPVDVLAGSTDALTGEPCLSSPSSSSSPPSSRPLHATGCERTLTPARRVAAYSSACGTLAPPATDFALTLPANWDGPFGQGLDTAGTVVTFIVALSLGLGLISVVNTM